MNVLVVESPAKAGTIGRYLGKEYQVLATYGHLRDLKEKTGSVIPEDDFRMVWEIDSESIKRIREIAKSLKGSERLILATDPDREGEAISWHLVEALKERKALGKSVAVERISFNSVTKGAVTNAIRNPRSINSELVDAYLARRALDYLVGFGLSPVLWRTLPGARSAGRVQSVALRLVVERESGIETFVPKEYWSVLAHLKTENGSEFWARLVALDGGKIGKFDIADETSARNAEDRLNQAAGFRVAGVEAKPIRQKPPAPFITSTLQQEASRKLGLPPTRTMATAQRLYEDALITYMRTDGVDMAPEAVAATRDIVRKRFGQGYLPEKPRAYRSRAKNAQEAHECIRPTDPSRTPNDIPKLSSVEGSLYRLIWERTLASQMADAQLERTTASIDALGKEGKAFAGLRATGQVVKFDGFRRLYREGRDDTANESNSIAPEEDTSRLPALGVDGRLENQRIEANQHFTAPPPRFTEASLVRRLEELGIGRPSTYASILSVIQNRGYAEIVHRRITPTFLGRVATSFLEAKFARYVAYDFTANLERDLDEISGGRATRSDVLGAFWRQFEPALGEAGKLSVRDAVDAVEEVLEPVLFPARSDGEDPRTCPKCGEGRLGLRPSRRSGMFVGCGRYPDCDFTRSLENGEATPVDWTGDRTLGLDADGTPVLVRKGPYGFYFQVGSGEGREKPKRASLPEGLDPAMVELDLALRILALPRIVGLHPETRQEITAGVGRYGPYVRHDRTYANLPKNEDVLEIGLNRAVDLLAAKSTRVSGSNRFPALRELGEHPEGGGVTIRAGRYGPYVNWKRLNASLPKSVSPEELTMEEALTLLARRKSRERKKS